MAFFLPLLNVFYYCYLPLISLLYEIVLGAPMVAGGLLRGTPLDEIMRRHNQIYGQWIVTVLWPLWRVRVSGRENVPLDRPCVVVANHRSFADIFMVAMTPTPGAMLVMVRSWPFRMPVLGWFMRLARYVDLERTPMEDVIRVRAAELLPRRAAFVFFPEGHRSRDGRLQRFRSGAFRLAAELDVPVVPVCIQGSEAIAHRRWPLLQPVRVTIEILPPVSPDALPEENRAVKLQRRVEQLFRDHLGE